MLDFYVEPVPAQMRLGHRWFLGSADALHQSLNVVTDEEPDFVAVFSSDHIYKMDVRQIVDAHIASGAGMTVAAIPVPVAEASSFGVIGVDASGRMTSFTEKPPQPAEMPDRPGWSLASMGNYIWNTATLVEELKRDARAESAHDFGRNVLPALLGRVPVNVYDFAKNDVPGASPGEKGYWRDVGTIQAYYEANLDLVQVTPSFDLYNPRWPVRTWSRPLPPAKFVFADEAHARVGIATDSLVCEGCILSGGRIDRCVLSPNVRVNSYSHVEASILLENVNIGRRARVRRAIIDKNVSVPEGETIGYDLESDRARGFTVLEEEDLVVVPKGHRF
jgi:glucose-1-phosphate adenylyltransferase